MPEIIYKTRLIGCPKNKNYSFREHYKIIGGKVIEESTTYCPKTVTYKENDKPQCNGYITPERPCPYAYSKQ